MSQAILPPDLNLSPILPVSIERYEADRYSSTIQHTYVVGRAKPAPFPAPPWVVMAARTQQLLDAVASGDAYRQAMLEVSGIDSIFCDR